MKKFLAIGVMAIALAGCNVTVTDAPRGYYSVARPMPVYPTYSTYTYGTYVNRVPVYGNRNPYGRPYGYGGREWVVPRPLRPYGPVIPRASYYNRGPGYNSPYMSRPTGLEPYYNRGPVQHSPYVRPYSNQNRGQFIR
jgi:hypothetical protein